MIFFSFQRSEKLEFQSWPFGNFGLDRLASDTACCSAHHATPMLCGTSPNAVAGDQPRER